MAITRNTNYKSCLIINFKKTPKIVLLGEMKTVLVFTSCFLMRRIYNCETCQVLETWQVFLKNQQKPFSSLTNRHIKISIINILDTSKAYKRNYSQ